MYSVSSGGYNSRHPLDFSMSRPNGLAHYLLLIVKCPALFHIGEEKVKTERNCAMLIRPNVPYQYRSINGEYTDDWLHFDCDDPHFPENTSLLFHRPIPVDSVVRFTLFIQQIMWERNYASQDFQAANIDLLMSVLINNLVQSVQKMDMPVPYNPYLSRLQNIRLSMQSRPCKNLTPRETAQELGISSSYFQHLYKELFGISFKADLIHIRIDYAKELILNTDLKLTQIARLCGYSNEIHFYRQFKAKTGMTPGEFQEKAKEI